MPAHGQPLTRYGAVLTSRWARDCSHVSAKLAGTHIDIGSGRFSSLSFILVVFVRIAKSNQFFKLRDATTSIILSLHLSSRSINSNEPVEATEPENQPAQAPQRHNRAFTNLERIERSNRSYLRLMKPTDAQTLETRMANPSTDPGTLHDPTGLANRDRSRKSII